MVLAPEKLQPGQSEAPALDARVEDANQILRTPEDEEKLGQALERRAVISGTQPVVDDQSGEEVLHPSGTIPALDEITFTEVTAKKAWHAPVTDYLRWWVENWQRSGLMKVFKNKKQTSVDGE